MLIPLGILASSGGGAAGSFDLISTTLLSGSQASVTFDVTGLGATYKHLQIRAVARMSAAQNGASGNLRINGDTANNYSSHYLQGTGSAVQSAANTTQPDMRNVYAVNAGTDVTNAYAAIIVDVLDAFSTSKYKTTRVLSGVPGNESRIRLGSGLWMSTSATTSLTMVSDNGGNFVAGSRFSLYGIKA